MSDTHEEQLLSDLLTRIAREDAGLDAAHLEARVMDASAHPMQPTVGAIRRRYVVLAAAVVTAAMVPGIAWMTRDVSTPTVNSHVAATAAPAFAPPALRRGKPAPPALRRGEPANPAVAPPVLRRGKPTRPTPPTNPAQPSLAEEFVPLMPMTEQELAGPFQLVRVQMPRASLGALRSPLDHPNELVEADVLLGEDGMARAIRVSTGASVYPWRSR